MEPEPAVPASPLPGAAPAGPPRRLMITQMVLENFKSYAGAQSVGPFHKSFSSVVGPNGSGKSNVIDAMLFVFGKRAKQLRLNKVSELIHNSTHHRNLEMARVSVHFQEIVDIDDEGFEAVPGSQFVISRTAHRNNSSNYYINDRKSNFTEVTDLLKGKGVDLDNNRFLILQGEVEQISMMKPKGQTEHETGLLEYLEDIIGTDKYIACLDESAKRLEALNEQRQSMLQRVKTAQKGRDSLAGDKDAAETYLAKERACLGEQSVLAQVLAAKAQVNVEKIEGNVGKLEERLAHERQKFAQYDEVLKEHEARYNAVNVEYQGIAGELEKATGDFKEFERKDIKYREDLKHLKAKLKKLEDKSGKDGAKAGELQAEVARLGEEVPALQVQVADMEAQLAKAQEVRQGLEEGIRGEVEGYRAQLEGVKAELAPWEAQMKEVQARIDVAASERDLLTKQHEQAVARHADAKAALAAAQAAAKERTGQIKEMEASVEKYRLQAQQARANEAAAQQQVEQLEAALREVRGRVEQRRADASSQVSQGAVVQALMEAKQRGDIEGIYGRLGDLGAIAKEYDIAVSTACGALDYIVVETTSAAQRCVELLRQRQLGVATFLILEKQQHLSGALKEKKQPPEGVKRLFDLVKCTDDRLRVAFYYALRDTVVAGDLEQASRIAYGQDKRWRRVVTLKGEMINESGTMTGGGGKPRGGRMLLGSAAPRAVDGRAAAAELQTAEAELNASQEALRAARDALSDASSEAKNAERMLADLETAIPKARMEAEAALATAADLQSRLGELEAATHVSGEDAARLKALGADIAREEKALAELRRKSEGLSKKVEALQAQIEGAGGEKLRRQRALCDKLQEDITACESEATKKGVQAASAQKQLDKLHKEVAKADAEREKLAAQQQASMQEFKALEEAAFAVLEAVRRTEGELAAKEGQLNDIRADFESKKKEVATIRQVEVDIQDELDKQKSAHKEERSKVRYWGGKAAEAAKAIEERDGAAPAPLTPDQLEAPANQEKEVQYRITMLEEELSRMDVDLEAIEKWRQKDAEYAERTKDLQAATAERDEVRRDHEELRKRRLDEFMAGFNVIGLKLKEMYQMITLGGDAELELVDSLDPFAEGILFSVRPPKKSWKNIANLSGGEKTLSSLSLVFALHHYKPTPLYVMDEIDAALDFKNVSIVGHYIKERTKNAQFVIISLRNNMFELADRLVGIYKTDNATKSVAINPHQFAVGGRGAANGAAPQCGGRTAAAGNAADKEQQPPEVAAA
ncbi:structural maintenance of chromosomes 4 [Micractinium conductrix]|uniref:Structural maintenance of chromosomes protein n=1 Tax=Micractinium conductrix TaxID=554055 RepID=A0A2P6VDK1_9CHLO|nr:structural maintenance of chromosomes 4 [Micractinium conductrix]|eukprot:PSC72157.1 structural maintenance of chromosomes 4 [Micractinium conductrix]